MYYTTSVLRRSALRLSVTILFFIIVSMASYSDAQSKPVASVNGHVLKEVDLLEAMNDIFPAAVFHGGITPDKMEKYRPKALELMVEKELYYQEAKARGMKVPDKKVAEAKETRIENLGGKNTFKKALKQWGITEEEFERMLEKKFLIGDIQKAEINDKAAVSNEEAKAYYDKNKTGFMRPEAVHIIHILISVSPSSTEEEKAQRRKRAEEVLKKARSGEDMSNLAWEYSDDPYRVKGGDMGLIHKGMLDPDLEKEVFKVKSKEISGIIETIYGFHIVKIEEKRQPEQLSYEDIAEKIKNELREKRLQERKKNFLAELKSRAKVEIY